jgi:class 3 adenylate cyclase/tetratricopeptide (TPR) repeat protein
MTQCPRCRHDNPARAKFCLECGARLPLACPACGAALPATAKFCLECGRAVAAGSRAARSGAEPGAPPEVSDVPAAPGPPGGPEARTPATYTPAHLAEKILTSRAALEGERKPVTVLFCDLVGSTALAERLGPEGMHALLNRFFEVALAEVHRYEGTVNQFLGDGFMALFGAPLAHEDHARRAALAALGVAQTLRERPLAVGASAGVPVTVRMGLHTGFVVVGAIGDNLRMDYTAVGDTTHLAARLQQLAEPGAILASEATWRLVEGYVRGERLGPVTVKGRGAAVVVVRLVGVGPRRAPLEGVAERPLSQFVGRERELRTLRDLFTQVEGGQGQAVGIVGEPGVGKSRLLLEFRRALLGRRVTYLAGRCLSYGAAIPYVPVADIVRANAGLVDTDPPEAVAEKLRFGLQEVGLEGDDALPCLLRLLGVKDPSGRLDLLSPEAVKARTFDTLRQLCLRGSRRQPLVLEVEDLHWIDRTSEELLALLAETLAGASILLVTTYRPGHRPPWSDRSFATQLSLARLAPAESLSIVRGVLPTAGLGDPLARQILEKAEGNPFFLEELARAVGDRGVGTGVPVPDTVHGVLMARIDRLAEAPKRLLQTASVLGREFSARLLAAIWRGPGDLEPHLRELARLEFLFERATGPEAAYAFKHALTQDVAEATLLPSRRRELHRAAAEALERLHAERLAELAPVLAHHYGEAEAWAPAALHAGRAAAAARAAFANREALARYDQAITAAERAGLPPAERQALHEGRGGVHTVLGDFEPARADYEAALALARAEGDALGEARALGALSALWGGHRDYARGLDLARQAVTAVERADDGPPAQRALGEARLGVGLMEMNLARASAARRELEQALALFRSLGDAAGEGRVLDVLAMTVLEAGDLDAAIACYREALPRLAAAGDRQTETSCAANLGFALLYRGHRAEGEPWIQRALESARTIGARAHEAYVHVVVGELVEPYGDWGRALRALDTGLAIARELGHREWTAVALATLGRIQRQCGDVAGARARHEEMLAIARELGTALWIADALGELGEDLVAAGATAEGARYLADAVTTAAEALKFAMRPLLALAQLALRAGRPDEALAHARRVQALVPQFVHFAADARRAEGEALLAAGHAAEAEGRLRSAKAEAGAAGAAPAAWRAALALARLLAAGGREAEARAEQAEARRLVERVAADLAGFPALRARFETTPPFREAAAP